MLLHATMEWNRVHKVSVSMKKQKNSKTERSLNTINYIAGWTFNTINYKDNETEKEMKKERTSICG